MSLIAGHLALICEARIHDSESHYCCFYRSILCEEAGMALFELCDVTVSYSDLLSPQSDGPTSRGEDVSKADRASQQSSVPPVNDVSLALDAGCIYDLTGPSGSGKTTLCAPVPACCPCRAARCSWTVRTSVPLSRRSGGKESLWCRRRRRSYPEPYGTICCYLGRLQCVRAPHVRRMIT